MHKTFQIQHWFFGTAEFLQSHPEFIDSDEQEIQVDCNKDTGGRRTLHSWSRGIVFIVSAGGHIDYWQPLYRYFLRNW